jgi:hypothetical protein
MNEIGIPKYIGYIWAAKIKEIIPDVKGGAVLQSDDSDHDFFVSEEYIKRWNPMISDYYIIHKDGYESCLTSESISKYFTLIEGKKL